MRRVGGLYPTLCRFDHLLASFVAARRGTGWNGETQAFFVHLEPELLRLTRELRAGSYHPGPYRYFSIRDPKPRTISVAPFRDRVVHHALVSVLEPVFEPTFIFDSYATRKGKGTHRAILRAQRFARRWPWYLKLDIRHFFETVRHERLLALIARKVKDPRVLELTATLIGNSREPGIGLPIGNLTSQFFANVYLNPLDHLVKDRWRVPAYLRYMDDFVLFADEKAALADLLPKIETFLRYELDLELKHRACWLNRVTHGLSFLGMRIFPVHIRLRGENRRRSLRRVEEAIRAWEAGYDDDERLARRLASLQGHLRYFDTRW